jgi:hypothetical protein
MPPAKDFRREKLKSQVIAGILLIFFFETIARTGYTGGQTEAIRQGG